MGSDERRKGVTRALSCCAWWHLVRGSLLEADMTGRESTPVVSAPINAHRTFDLRDTWFLQFRSHLET